MNDDKLVDLLEKSTVYTFANNYDYTTTCQVA